MTACVTIRGPGDAKEEHRHWQHTRHFCLQIFSVLPIQTALANIGLFAFCMDPDESKRDDG